MALNTSRIMDKYGITASEIRTTAKGIMKRDLAQLSCAKDRALVADEIKALTTSPDKASKANGKANGKVQGNGKAEVQAKGKGKVQGKAEVQDLTTTTV